MNLKIILSLAMVVISSQVFATKVKVSYPRLYPFVAVDTDEIYSTVQTVTEDESFIRNLGEMISLGLSKSSSKIKPWTSSYWPLSKGTIADPYENSNIEYNVDFGWVDWKNNYKSLIKRREKVHPRIEELSQKELDKLAPSEKYDLLIGDYEFDLTNRLVDYMGKWGSLKSNAFITNISLVGEDSLELAKKYIVKYSQQYPNLESAFRNSYVIKDTLSVKYALDLVERGQYSTVVEAFPKALEMANLEGKNFVLKKKNSRMATWEGICNGWSTAATLVPRPRKMVSFKLPNKKKLNFYPEDIKGLLSLFWVNSNIQDQVSKQYINPVTKQPTIQGSLIAGTRCNSSGVKKDIWGRLYKATFNSFSGRKESPCSGVHPATWHLGVVNLIGKQKRSFIVERKVGAAVDNHPMHKYSMKYFNPYKTRKKFDPQKNKNSFEDVIVELSKKDPFLQLRNNNTKFIVGVEMTMTYLHYSRPKRKLTDSEENDKEVSKKMFYDLELDENLNIIGGQWRATKNGLYKSEDQKLNHNQPDFFWVISKGYKKTGWFSDEESLEPWTDHSMTPPKSWLKTARAYHSYNVEKLYDKNLNDSCQLIDKRSGKAHTVLCESVTNKPQPLINVLNKLVELSK